MGAVGVKALVHPFFCYANTTATTTATKTATELQPQPKTRKPPLFICKHINRTIL